MCLVYQDNYIVELSVLTASVVMCTIGELYSSFWKSFILDLFVLVRTIIGFVVEHNLIVWIMPSYDSIMFHQLEAGDGCFLVRVVFFFHRTSL